LVELVRLEAEKVAAETAVTEHSLEDREVAEATEPDQDLEMKEALVHLKEVTVADQLEMVFTVTLVALAEEA
jgi:hypothetical protein